MASVGKVHTFLWLDSKAEEAAKFYVSLFPNSKVLSSGEKATDFELDGHRVTALNGGPHFKLNEALSLFVTCETQEEVDTYWEKLTTNGGKEIRCGWLQDKYGVTWQIVPRVFMELTSSPDKAAAGRVFEAMMTMQKLDIAKLQAAFDGKSAA